MHKGLIPLNKWLLVPFPSQLSDHNIANSAVFWGMWVIVSVTLCWQSTSLTEKQDLFETLTFVVLLNKTLDIELRKDDFMNLPKFHSVFSASVEWWLCLELWF